MLQALRDKIQGWIATTIIGLIILTFALWGIHNYYGGGNTTITVAKVNGMEITEAQLNAAYDHLRNNLQLLQTKAPLALSSAEQNVLRNQALQQLISNQVLTQAAIKRGYIISQAQINEAIMQLPQFQINGRFSPDLFAQVLNANGYTQNQFLAELSSGLVVNQVQNGVVISAFALPNEIQTAQTLLDQRRDIAYFIIPTRNFVTTASVSPSEIQAYYQQHQDEFKTPEKIKIEYVQLNASDVQNKIKLNEQEINQYYQDNQAAFSRNGKLIPLAQAREQIIKALTLQKTQQLFSEQSQQLSDLTFTNPNSLAPAASALGLKVMTTDYFDQQGAKTGIAANPKVIAAAFSNDVAKQGNNSNIINLADGQVIVLRAQNVQPASVLSLSQVNDAISQTLKQKKAEKEAAELGQKIAMAMQQGITAENISKQYHLNWQQVKTANRQAKGVDAQILRAAFALPNPAKNKPAITGATLTNGDFAVVVLQGVQESTVSQTSPSMKVLQNELTTAYGQLDYLLYVNDLLEHAKVKIIPQTQQND